MPNSRLQEFFVIAMAAPLVALPFYFWYWPAHEPYGLSWLQLVSAAVFVIAVVLTVLKSVVPRLRRFCEFSVPRVVQFLALAILALVALWTLAKGD